MTGGAWTVRCTTLTKPDVGTVHLHRRWWRPARTFEVGFTPVGETAVLPVPVDSAEQLLAVDTAAAGRALIDPQLRLLQPHRASGDLEL